MPHPVVLRVTKLSKIGNVAASGSHNWRERETPNADPKLTANNIDLRPVVGAAALVAAVKARAALADEAAPDAVPCIEYLVTAHAQAFADNGGTVDADAYLRDAFKWIEEKHGADNVVAASIHVDEKAKHLIAYVVPLVQHEAKTRKRSVIAGTNPDGSKRRETREFTVSGKLALSAAHYLDGRAKLSKMQTDFAAQVGAKHGLERGIEGSRATHQTVKRYYSLLGAPIERLPAVKTKDPGEEPNKLKWAAHRDWETQRDKRAAEIRAYEQAAARVVRKYETRAMQASMLESTVAAQRAIIKTLAGENIAMKRFAELGASLTQDEAAEVGKRAKTKRKLTKIADEAVRRVRDLTTFLGRKAGAAFHIASDGLKQLKTAGGVASRVDWEAIEQEAARKALETDRQKPDDVIRETLEVSPLCANELHHNTVREHVAAAAQKLENAKATARDDSANSALRSNERPAL